MAWSTTALQGMEHKLITMAKERDELEKAKRVIEKEKDELVEKVPWALPLEPADDLLPVKHITHPIIITTITTTCMFGANRTSRQGFYIPQPTAYIQPTAYSLLLIPYRL